MIDDDVGERLTEGVDGIHELASRGDRRYIEAFEHRPEQRQRSI